MSELMRCVVPHWQGDKFIPKGYIQRSGHAEVIPAFFEVYHLDGDDEPQPPPKRGRGK